MSVVELAPVVKTIEVRRSAADAFRIFTEQMSAWWPLQTHTLAEAAKGQKCERVTIEPAIGGRVYETLNDGTEHVWGEVLAYEPGLLFAMTWHVGLPPERATEVCVRFEPLSPTACRVTLTHARWDRMGADGPQMRAGYNSGWATVFERCFKDFADME